MSRALEAASLHPRPRAARGESVPGLEPAGRLAARVRRPGDRPGAGRGVSHREGRRSRIRCMPISCAPATRRCRSSTRSTASATAAASRHAAWWRSSTGRRSSPWPRPSIRRSRGCTTRSRCQTCRRRRALPSEAELKGSSLIERLPRRSRPIGSASGRSRSGRSICRAISRRATSAPTQQVWIRANGKARRRSRLHQCVLAYASDFTLLDTALDRPWPLRVRSRADAGEPRPRDLVSSDLQGRRLAALRPRQPSSGAGRAFCRGTLFTREGELVASTAQEGLVRERSARNDA